MESVMIIGTITADREAAVPLTVHGSGSQSLDVEVVIDTGFNGFLTLPPALISPLGLAYHSQIIVILGDGSASALRQFEGTVDWDGQMRDVLVLEADGDPLIGMALLYGSRMTLDIVDGGDVTIETRP